ncbi:hypothetical protein CHARACLAT_021138 [Characodon lateralis]|uniref:Uncharacterized protein n=1 Tax=Characodon lateralis TaxID=208331 RepID=A0ABU7E3N1_9TELE|nr:hypothetical protein [Characodon lateralis]
MTMLTHTYISKDNLERSNKTYILNLWEDARAPVKKTVCMGITCTLHAESPHLGNAPKAIFLQGNRASCSSKHNLNRQNVLLKTKIGKYVNENSYFENLAILKCSFCKQRGQERIKPQINRLTS